MFIENLTSAPLLPLFSILLYFSVLTLCVVICFSRALQALPYTGIAWINVPLAFLSLYVTWIQIFSFIKTDYVAFEAGYPPYSLPSLSRTLGTYLRESSWFDAAYLAVLKPLGWFYSLQLLNVASVIIVLIWSEGPQHWYKTDAVRKVGPWARAGLASAFAYLLLGFLGAMSVCFALFLVQREVVEGTYVSKSGPRLTWTVRFLFAFYVAGVALTPKLPVDSTIFGIYLKLLHLALMLPILGAAGPALVSHPRVIATNANVGKDNTIASLYAFMALSHFISQSAVMYHIFASFHGRTTGEIVKHLYDAIFDNPCQISITADLAFATIIGLLFILREARKGLKAGKIEVKMGVAICAGSVLLVPFIGISVVLPAFLALREYWRSDIVKFKTT